MSLRSSIALLAFATYTSQAATSDLEHISVFASRQAKPVNEVNASVTVFDRSAIDLYQPKDLPALLNLLPGVQVSREGGRGQTSSIFIRGSRTKHALVLIDGVRTGSATLGYQELSQLPMELIESVELIRGPRAALYGSDAVAGVIAITTRQQTGLHSVLRLGSHQLQETALHGRVQQGDTSFHGSVGFAKADGFSVLDNPKADPDADGFRNRFVRFGATERFGLGEVALNSQLVRGYNQYDYNPTWGGADEASTVQDLHQLSGRWQQSIAGFLFQHQGHIAYSHDDSLNYGNGSAASSFVTDRIELDYQGAWQFSDTLQLLAGLTRRDEDVEKTGAAYVRDSRLIQSVFAGLTKVLGQWTLDGTVRHDHVSAYGDNSTYQWGLSYQLTPQLQARVNQGSAYKVPTFNDLYYPGFNNPSLKPEESLSKEAGLRFQAGGRYQLSFDAVHFVRDLTNMIAWNNQSYQSENIASAKLHGLEYSINARTGAVQHQLMLTYTDGEDLQTQSRVLPDVPKQKYTYLLSGDVGRLQWSANAQYRDAVLSKVTQQQSLPSVVLFGVGAGYQFSELWQLQLNLDNLLDKNYQTARGYRQGGRELSLSVQSRWF